MKECLRVQVEYTVYRDANGKAVPDGHPGAAPSQYT